MPISVECPECGTRNRFPDHLAGKSGRCKSCRERISVQEARKRTSKKKKNQSSNTGIVAGIAVGLLVLIGGGLFFLLNSDEKLEQNQIVNGERNEEENSTQTSPSSVDPIDSSMNSPESQVVTVATPQHENPSKNTELSKPTVKASSKPSNSSSGGFTNPASSQAAADRLTFNRSQAWSVAVDPLLSSIQFESGKDLRVKIDKNSLRGSGVLFPTTASPFIAVLSGSSTNAKYQIFDITSGRQIGETPGGSSSALAVLAPDGKYLALSTSVAEKIEVFDIPGKKSLGVLQLSDDARFQISTIAIWNDRLVALSTIQRGFKVWELPSGKLLQHVTADDKFNPDYGHCFSPNGKYLAVDGQFLEKRVDIYELLTGELKGSISPAGKVRVDELEALGFSLDGTQLGLVYGVNIFSQPSRKYSRVVIWDLEPGTVAADFEIEPKLKDQLDPVYQSHTLQSLPGGKRWLAHSSGIIDAGVEQLVYSFPKQADVTLVTSRKVMGPNWLLSVSTEKGTPQFEQTTFTEESLLAGAASAAAGGIASDATMPPLTPSNPEQASDGLPSQQWEAQPDRLNAGTFVNTVNVSTKGIVRDIALARGPDSIVAIRAGIDEDLNDPKITGYEQSREIFASRGLVLEKPQPIAKESEVIAYNVAGTEIARLMVPFSGQLQGISSDGKLAVLEQHRTNGRLDVYALENEGKHLIGWRPFGSEGDKNHRELKRVEFIDGNHLVTLNENYKLVVWKLPGLEPVWKYDEAIDFSVSPAGNQLAVVQGGILGAKGINIFESRTGNGLGTVDLEGKIRSLAFHSSGEFLAVSIDAEANKTIRIVDMNTGSTLEEIPVPVVANRIAWTGTDNLLLNGSQLLNRPLEAIVWSYTAKEVELPQFQINDQFTFLASFGKRAVVHTVELPDSSVAAKLTPDRLSNLAIMKPGDQVTLTVQVPSGAEVLPLEADVREALTKSLETAGSKVSENASVRLAVKISSKSDGNVALTKIGDRSVSENVTRKFIILEFEYTNGGKIIWSSTRRVGNLDRFLVRLKAGQSAQVAIDEQMLEQAGTVLKNMKLPKFIFKATADQGLGSSPLTGE